MSDRDIKSFEERLASHCEKKWSNYERLRIDLSIARNYYKFDVAGEFIEIEQASDADATAGLILDFANRDVINIGEHRIIETVFSRFFISNAAQVGEWLDLLIGRNFKSHVYGTGTGTGGGGGTGATEVQQVLNLTHANPNTSVQAAANACIEAIIKADVENTDIAWIDFGAAAAQNSCIPLDPGEWIKVPITNTNRIYANFEVGGEIVYIAYAT